MITYQYLLKCNDHSNTLYVLVVNKDLLNFYKAVVVRVYNYLGMKWLFF